MGRIRYDSSDDRLREQLTVDELTRYYENQPHRTFGDSFSLKHLLYRCMSTIATLERDRQQLRSSVERLRADKPRTGAPTTLSPLDALRYATPAEVEMVVTQLNRTQLSALAQVVHQSTDLQQQLANDLARTQNALASVLSDPSLPAEVRTQIQEAYGSLPASSEPVTIPAVLSAVGGTDLLTPEGESHLAAARLAVSEPQLRVSSPPSGALPAPEGVEPEDAVIHQTLQAQGLLRPWAAWQPGPSHLRQ